MFVLGKAREIKLYHDLWQHFIALSFRISMKESLSSSTNRPDFLRISPSDLDKENRRRDFCYYVSRASGLVHLGFLNLPSPLPTSFECTCR